MREQGINFPDPTFDIDGNPQFDNLEIENEEEQNAVTEWSYAVAKFAESTRTITRVMIQSWE